MPANELLVFQCLTFSNFPTKQHLRPTFRFDHFRHTQSTSNERNSNSTQTKPLTPCCRTHRKTPHQKSLNQTMWMCHVITESARRTPLFHSNKMQAILGCVQFMWVSVCARGAARHAMPLQSSTCFAACNTRISCNIYIHKLIGRIQCSTHSHTSPSTSPNPTQNTSLLTPNIKSNRINNDVKPSKNHRRMLCTSTSKTSRNATVIVLSDIHTSYIFPSTKNSAAPNIDNARLSSYRFFFFFFFGVSGTQRRTDQVYFHRWRTVNWFQLESRRGTVWTFLFFIIQM